MSADVVSFDQSKEQLTSEHLKLDWYTRVEQTAKMAGIPLLEDLLCRKSTSICVKEGSGNLRDLTATNALITLEAFLRNISGSGADAYTWDRWEIDAKAASLAKSLSISTEFHPQEIISFYDDVSRHLSRRPADSQEFWHVLFVITKNRSDSKILSSISAERELDKICKGLSHDYKDSLARINVLDSALNYKAEVFGDIPDNFSSRFGSASEVVKLHDQECANAINLKNELVRLGSDLATSEAIINELRLEVSMLRPSENIPRSLELRKAQDDVELAKQFLTRLNQSNTELGLTIKMKESAISSLKTLNCRLTSFVREKNARVRHLERAQKLARTLSNRLAGMARRYKIAEATVKIELRDQRLLNEKLKEKTSGFRRIKILCTTGIVLLTSFSLVITFYITTL
jgi:hypothetical protein